MKKCKKCGQEKHLLFFRVRRDSGRILGHCKECESALDRERHRSRPREYKIWIGMRRRCRDDPNYAGRGIAIDPRWCDYTQFFEDMGPCPPGFSLERIDNDGDYGPDNCRWASVADQNRNRRSTLVIKYGNIVASLSEHCEKLNLHYGTVLNRHKNNIKPPDLFCPTKKTWGDYVAEIKAAHVRSNEHEWNHLLSRSTVRG